MLDRVRNRLLGIHGCVGSRWLGRSLLGVQLMLPALGVAFSALLQLSPEGKGEVGRKREQAPVTEGTAGSPTTQWCRNRGFCELLSLKHFFFMLPGSCCCQDLQSAFPSGSVSLQCVWCGAGLEEGGFVSPLDSLCSVYSLLTLSTLHRDRVVTSVCVACHQNQAVAKSDWKWIYNK